MAAILKKSTKIDVKKVENQKVKKLSKIMLAWEKHEPLITSFDRRYALL